MGSVAVANRWLANRWLANRWLASSCSVLAAFLAVLVTSTPSAQAGAGQVKASSAQARKVSRAEARQGRRGATNAKRGRTAKREGARLGRRASASDSSGERSPQVYRPKRPLTIGMVGLGRMGGRMAERLVLGGHGIIGYDTAREARGRLAEHGGVAAGSLPEVVEKLPSDRRRVVWVMLPAGEPTEHAIGELAKILRAGDVIIDGGNSNYRDTLRRAEMLQTHGIELVDVGTSGGVLGFDRGYSLMIGGRSATVRELAPVFRSLAPGARKGWGRVGPVGTGHRAKMIHNAIEYGQMAALAEGLMLAARGDHKLDLRKLTGIWNDGSIIESRLLRLVSEGLKDNPALRGLGTEVPDSGEGRWAVKDAVDHGVPMPVNTTALMERFNSQRARDHAGNQLLQLMRLKFGGHKPVPEEE